MLILDSFVYDVPAGQIIDGKCEGEQVTLQGCDPLFKLKKPEPKQWLCAGPSCEEQSLEKLCDILEAIEELSMDLPEAAGVTQIGCVKGENKGDDPVGVVLACKHADGGLDRLVMVPLDGSPNTDPYEGPFSLNCGPAVYTPVDLWVDDQESPLCGYRVYICDGEKFILNPTTCEYEALPMGTITTPYQPRADKVCRPAQIGPFPLEATGATDIETIVADALAADPQVFDFNGTEVPVTIDDIKSFRITPKNCDVITASGLTVVADFVNINGEATGGHLDDIDGGINLATAVEVPVGGCSTVEICFESCLTKQEIAAL